MKQLLTISFILINCVSIFSQEVDLKRGLVAYYPFNGNANDESGNKNNGKVYGAALTDDKLGNKNSAYYFDGNSYITVPDNNSIDFTNSLSIFAWINLEDATNNQKIISKVILNNMEGGYIFGIDKSQLYPEIFDKWNQKIGGPKGNSVIPSNSWTLIGVTFNNNIVKYYCNDQCIAELPVNSTSLYNNSSNLIIGTNSWENPPSNLMVRGKIDEVRLYNRALNLKEIQSLFALFNIEPTMAPGITWNNPENNITSISNPYIDIKACLKTKKPLTGLQVYLNNNLYYDNNGRGYNVAPKGLCDIVLEQRIMLIDGENKIKIIAVNDGGTSISDERSVFYQSIKQDITGPVITLIQPQGQRGFKMVEENNQINVTGKATDESGIYKITVNDVNATFNTDGIFRNNVNLASGENAITIRATDNKQNNSEFTFYVSHKSSEVVVNKIITTNEKRIALVIGNGAYPSAPLKNPVNDAALISTELKKFGFEVTTITDGSQNQIKKAISDYGDLLSTDKSIIGLFYYAGHGIQAKGKNYIIPVDAKVEKEADVVVYCVDLDDLMANLEYAGNNLNMVILDACRNNPFGRGFRSAAGTGLATVNAPSGTIIAFATAPGSTAADGEGNNGLYTQEFVKVLQVPNLKLEDVFKKVRTQVKTQSGGKQIPWENSALEGDFYFKQQ